MNEHPVPGSGFERPEDLLRSDVIDRREKISRLEAWEYQVLHRLDSTYEGMPPNGTTDRDMEILIEIDRALVALDHRASPRGPTWRERQRTADEESAKPGHEAANPRG